MKRIIKNHVGSWSSVLLAVWLLAGFAPMAHAAFTGDYTSDNWQLDANSFNPGTYLFLDSGTAQILRLTGVSTPGFSDTLLALQAPYATAPGVLDFSWTLTANGNVGAPFAYFYVGSTVYELALGSGSLTGIQIPTNTPLYFELLSDVTAGKSPAKLEIKNWGIRGAIGGTVWVDVNGNGVLDPEEAGGLGGVTVVLQTTNGTPVVTNVTAAAGTYLFTNVPPGHYLVVETDLPGWISTADSAVPNDNRIPLTLVSGETSTGNDFLDTQLARIAGTVLRDDNGNGQSDPGETNGVAGVTIVLQTTNGIPVATNVTSAGGAYLFTNVPPGDYVLVEIDPPGWMSIADTSGTNDNRIPVTLTTGQVASGGSFFDAQPVRIAGSVRLDVNGNGVDDPEDTNAVPAAVIQVYASGTNLVATVTDNADGSYVVTNLPPGDYAVVQTVPPGYIATTATNVAVTVASGGTGTANFLDLVTYSIGNRVFADANGNGSRDYGESGIAGVRMVVFAANGLGNPSGSALMSVTTDSEGDYRFDGLLAGSYVVVVDQANSPDLTGLVSSAGYSLDLTTTGDMRDHGRDTPVTVGTVVNGIAGPAVTLGLGLQPTNEVVANPAGMGQHGPSGDAFDNLVVDFSFAPTFSLGNRVFYDDNHNGFQDAGENGVPGVPMYAFAADTNGAPTGAALASATTDANGWYRLDGLRAGTYAVVMDKAMATNLSSYTVSIAATNQMGLDGDLWNHGWYFPLITVGNVTNGYASAPVTVGYGLEPAGEATNGVAGASAHGPLGDAYDNLVLDFGLMRTFCIGNRVFADDGSGGGIANNGIQDGTEPGIPNVALRVFAADISGNPTGDPLVIGAAGLNVAVTDTNGYYRFFRMAAGTYVVVVDVELSRNLIGYTNLGGATVQVPGAHSSSLVGYASSLGHSTNVTLAGDLLDHGKDTPVSLGVVNNGIAGPPITLGDGLQPLGEATNGVAGSGAHGPTGDAFDNLTMDFGFALTFSLGNRVFADDGSGGGTAGNGIQDGGEPGIANATVQLQTNGVTMATATTDANGYYRFDDLLAGFYTVFLPATDFAVTGALAGMLSSTGTQPGDRGDKGVDNASPAVNGIVSTPIAVGLGLQPAGETDLGTGAGGHGLNGDAYDNLMIDFGLVGANSYPCSIGSLVWHDANNNGVYDTGESGINGVAVEVWSSDVSGNLLGGSAVATTATAADGTYFVGNLSPGTYRVKLPAGNFGTGGPLNSANTSSTPRRTQDDQVDSDNNGLQASAGGEVLSPVIRLSRGGEPVNGAAAPNEFGLGATLDDGAVDANGDMTVDFGFYSPTTDRANLCSLGSMVWNDANNNGVWDSGETGIAGVTLELYQTNAGGRIYWGETTSGSDGTYFFGDLPSGSNWVIHISATNFAGVLATYPLSSGTPVNADNRVDSDNNGLQPGGLGAEVWSPVIQLVAGSEPADGSGESGPGYDRDDTGGYVDANGDMTVDFGFTPTYSLGNLVFLDVSNNGVIDGADLGLSGVSIRLFAADGSGSPTGTALAAATTDAGGHYRFDNLVKGTYVVVVDKANSPGLAGYVSSSGVSTNTGFAGDGKDHGKDTPVSVGTVVNGIAGVPVTLGPGLEPTGEATGSGAGAHGPNGDGTDNLAVDFGFTPTYSVGNRIYRDPDNDGQPDLDNLDEGGIDGVQMAVYAADGSGHPTGSELGRTTTSDGGFYRFDGLVIGTYVVVVDKANSPVLDRYVSASGFSTDVTASGEMYDHGQDTPLGAGSVLPGGVASGPILLGPGLQPLGEATWTGQGANGPSGDATDNLVIDFGFMPLYSLGNRVFLDNGAGGGTANNGIQDGAEPRVANVAMKLFAADGSGNPTGAALATTATDANGYYRFDGLPAGTYVIVVDKAGSAGLSGYVSSTGSSVDTTPAADRHDHGKDTPLGAGSVVPGGIASVPVALGTSGVVEPLGEPDVSTGAGAHGPNGDDADNLVMDFGFTPASSVAGSVWVDLNGNGVFDADDTNGISGVTIVLETSAGVPVATNLTGLSGAYLFTNVPPGNYVIVEVNRPGCISTGDSAPPNDDQIPLTLTSGESSTGNSFLDLLTYSLGNRVFLDNGASGGTAKNGVRDGAEPGIANVVVKLYAADGSGDPAGFPLADTMTDASGYYRFDGLFDGTYVAVVDAVSSGAALSGMVSSPGNNTNMTLAGDLRDHGKDLPLHGGAILPGGIASVPVRVGFTLQPTNETATVTGAGAHGPGGDTSDNLAVDFGFYTPPPTAALMAWLGVFVDQRQVWVTWRTLSERDLLAFEVWRSAKPGAEELVTPDLVFADGQAGGGTYRVPDPTAALPGRYTYRLVGWYADLTSEELAKVEVSLASEASADVVRITGLEMQEGKLRVRWAGGQPPYTLEFSPEFGSDATWTPMGPVEPGEMEAVVPAENGSGFLRVKGGAQP